MAYLIAPLELRSVAGPTQVRGKPDFVTDFNFRLHRFKSLYHESLVVSSAHPTGPKRKMVVTHYPHSSP